MWMDILKWGDKSITELGEIIPTEKWSNILIVELREVYLSGFFQDILAQLLG